MQLTKLEIIRYKNLRAFRESFESGLNLIKGPNEAGKSSLVEALTDLLFSDPGSARKELRDKVGWEADKSFVLSMEFIGDGKTYRLHKDFDSGVAVLSNLGSGEEINDRQKIQNIISECLGMANRDIFLATSTVRQDELDRVTRSAEAIKDKLEGLITGGREEVLASDALAKVEIRIKELGKEGHKHLGIIQNLEKNRAGLIYELDRTKREIDQIARNRLKLKETQSLLAGIETEFISKKAHMEKATKAARNEERLKELEGCFADLNNRVKSVQSSEKIVGRLKEKLSAFPKISRQDLSAAEEQTAQIRYLTNKKETVDERVRELAQKYKLARPGQSLKTFTILLFLISVLAGLYYYHFTKLSDPRFLFGGAAGLVIFAILASFWSSKSKMATALKIEMNLKKITAEEIVGDLHGAKTALDSLFEKYEVLDVNTLRSKYEDCNDIEKEIKSEVIRYDSWLDGKSLWQLEQELQEVTKNLAIENEVARELRIYYMNAEDSERLSAMVEALEKQKLALEASLLALRRQLEFAESGCELQASLEERLEELEARSARATYQLRVYETIKEFIEKARKNVLKASLGVLEQETSQILSEVTRGKYNKIKFDRQSLRFEVFSSEKDDWINPDQVLSRGTKDQLYLAARLALVRIISQDRKPILILDEPFLTFDQDRREQGLKILKRYSDEYQILVLSCNDYYDSSAKKKVELSETTRTVQPAII